MELTAKQIVKAIRICNNGTWDCEDCPVDELPGYCELVEFQAADTIERQEAEIASLRAELSQWHRAKTTKKNILVAAQEGAKG